jgi:hypothetical protein
MVRNLASLATGAIVAALVAFLVQTLSHEMFSGADALTEVRVAILVSWAFAVLAGGLVAMKLSGEVWMPWAMAGLVLAFAAFKFVTVTHPLWMVAFAPMSVALAAFATIKLFGSKT